MLNIVICKNNMRNIGIDLLRLLAMIMICLLHTLGQGGVLAKLSPMSNGWLLAIFLEVLSFGAVNCYGLISGYVGFKSGFKPHKIISLWFHVVFYTLVFLFAFKFIYPEMVSNHSIKLSLIPVVMGHYWYITAYFGIFFFMPLINRAVEKLNFADIIRIFVIMFLAYVFWPGLNNIDTFGFSQGYSTFWLLYLYLIGACLAKFSNKIVVSNKSVVMVYIFCILISFIGLYWIAYMRSIGNENFCIYNNFFLSYTSPLVLVAAICMVIFFAKMRFKNRLIKNIIDLLTPANLSVYLIQVNYFIWHKFMYKYAESYALCGIGEMLIKVLLSAVGIFVVCTVVDYGRIYLFKKVGIADISINILNVLSKNILK